MKPPIKPISLGWGIAASWAVRSATATVVSTRPLPTATLATAVLCRHRGPPGSRCPAETLGQNCRLFASLLARRALGLYAVHRGRSACPRRSPPEPPSEINLTPAPLRGRRGEPEDEQRGNGGSGKWRGRDGAESDGWETEGPQDQPRQVRHRGVGHAGALGSEARHRLR